MWKDVTVVAIFARNKRLYIRENRTRQLKAVAIAQISNTMKKIGILGFIIVQLFLALPLLYGQNKASIIQGKVAEQDNEPVMYASVVLKNDKKEIQGGTVTDASGAFKLQGDYKGKYLLEISFIGYSTKTMNVDCAGQKICSLGRIILKEDALQLGEVVVTGKPAEKSVSIEKTKINTAQHVAAATGSVIDVLRSASSVSVDNEENIAIRGNTNVLILIDGIPTTVGSLSAIPAASTQSIEVITSPDVKYDSEGTGGIINIITKRTSINGFNGMVSANYGFYDKMNGNIVLNWAKNKWNIGVNYNGKYEQEEIESELFRLFHKTTNTIEQSIQSDQTAKNHALGFNMVYRLSERNNLSFDWKLMSRHLNNVQSFENRYTSTNGLLSMHRLNDINFKRDAFEGAIGYKTRFVPDVSEMNFLLSVSRTRGRRPFYYYEDGAPVQKSLSKGHPLNAAFQTDYILKKLKGTWEAGLKMSYRENNIDYTFYDFNPQDLMWSYSNKYSNDLTHKEYIPAIYGMFSSKEERTISYRLGLRTEYSLAKLSSHKQAIEYDKNNLFVSPSLQLKYKFHGNQSLSFLYSRRITRPIYPQLSPYINMIDNNTYETGNKDLDPETVNKIDLGYSLTGNVLTLNANAYLNIAKDYITQISTIYDKDALMLTYVNGDTETKAGLDLGVKLKPLKWADFEISSNTYHGKTTGFYNEVNLSSSGWVNNSNLSVNISPLRGTDIQFQYFYSTRQYYPQFTAKASHFANVGVKQNLYKNKIQITALLTDVFNTNEWDIYSNNAIYNLKNYSKNKSRMLWVGVSYKINTFKSSSKKAKEEEDRSMIKLGN